MSGLDWQWPLDGGETLLWQGRPAPRCYTFRNWKLAAVGTFLFLASSFWLMLAYELYSADGYPWWLLLIPAPLVLLSLWFGPVTLLLARIRWEKEFYALTDTRLLLHEGLFSTRIRSFLRTDLNECRQKRYGKQLVSLRMEIRNQQPVILHCLEQPQALLQYLTLDLKQPAAKGDSV